MMHHNPVKGTCAARTTRLEKTLAQIAETGHGALENRLRELDGEWSVGRMVKATTGVLILSGLALSYFVNPWFALAVGLGGAMLAQSLFARHNWLGDLFHAIGFRTSCDIDHERTALKALRGDFRHLPTMHEIEDRDAISRFEDEGGPAFEHEHPRVAPQEAVQTVVEATRL